MQVQDRPLESIFASYDALAAPTKTGKISSMAAKQSSCDTVSISQEARNKMAQAKASKATEPIAPEDAETQASAPALFAKYMKEKKGLSSTESGSADSIEAIKKKIEALQKCLGSVANSKLPEETKQSHMEALQGELNALQQELSQLITQSAKK